MSASVPYISGDFTPASPVSLPEFAAPFPGVNEDYILTQRYMQLESEWTPLELNTVHPLYTDYILVEESPLEDQGSGIVRWTRTYARVPAAYDEPGGTYNYNFIGFDGVFGINVTVVTGRDRFTRTVPVKVRRDFFLVDAGEGSPAGPVYDQWENIPIIEALRYYYASTPELDVDFLTDSPPFAVATTPSRTQYEALIGTYIAAENSRVTRWKGLIYQRETLYVKAQ